MPKALVQVVVATAVWWALTAAEVAVGWRLGALLVGTLVVHELWQRLVPPPYLYLGAVAVADDDPLMLEARQKARVTLSRFLDELLPAHPQDSMVKFALETSDGSVENVWADVVAVSGERLSVLVRTLPSAGSGEPLTSEIGRGEILDWMVELPDGTLRGGFTNRALFAIYAREVGRTHPDAEEQLARFRDMDEPPTV